MRSFGAHVLAAACAAAVCHAAVLPNRASNRRALTSAGWDQGHDLADAGAGDLRTRGENVPVLTLHETNFVVGATASSQQKTCECGHALTGLLQLKRHTDVFFACEHTHKHLLATTHTSRFSTSCVI